MVNMDQVRTLEWKVKQAVQLIVQLRRENETLRGRLSETESRLALSETKLEELELLLGELKASQDQMEFGIQSALEELDNLNVEAVDAVEAPALPAHASPIQDEAIVETETDTEAETFEIEAQPAVAVQAEVELEIEAQSEVLIDETALDPALDAFETELIAAHDPAPAELESSEPESQQPGLGIF